MCIVKREPLKHTHAHTHAHTHTHTHALFAVEAGRDCRCVYIEHEKMFIFLFPSLLGVYIPGPGCVWRTDGVYRAPQNEPTHTHSACCEYFPVCYVYIYIEG